MHFRNMIFGLTAGLLAAASVWAQQPGTGGFGGSGFGRTPNLVIMLSNNKQLQDELKVEQDQVEKLSTAIANVREQIRDEMAKLRGPDSTPEQRAAVAKKLTDSYMKAASEVLKPEQMKRLTQIENQQAGIGLFSKEDAQKALKLSPEQKEKITAIDEGLQKEIRELAGNRGGFDPQTPTKMQTLRKEAMDKAQATLNEVQMAAFKDLVGAPFQLPLARAGGLGVGPGGGAFPGAGGGAFGGFARFQPGQILPPPVQASLNLTDEQKKQVEALQKEVDAKLEKILTEEQNKQLKDMQQGPARRGNRPAPGGNPPRRP